MRYLKALLIMLTLLLNDPSRNNIHIFRDAKLATMWHRTLMTSYISEQSISMTQVVERESGRQGIATFEWVASPNRITSPQSPPFVDPLPVLAFVRVCTFDTAEYNHHLQVELIPLDHSGNCPIKSKTWSKSQ
jgi:hypothetical protein